MNKDFAQKEMLSKHFAALGYYVQPETIVFFKKGVQEKRREITDIDVLGLRPTSNLQWERVLGDCKTHKSLSPANRIIWLKGLMSHFSSSTGVIIFQKQNSIDEDHKLFASSLGITLLEESEFGNYDKSLVYPAGSWDNPYDINTVSQLRNLPIRFPRLSSFCDYIYNTVWNEETLLDSIRKVIGEAQAAAKEFDPDRTEHLALVLDAAGVFAIGLAELVGIIHNQYLQPKSQNQLDDAAKMLLWGGRDNYEFIAHLRNELMIAKKLEQSPLTLPNWDQFLHLIRSMLDNPHLAFSVPQVLRLAAIDNIKQTNSVQEEYQNNLLLIKFSMMVTTYFCRASKIPVKFKEQLETEFIRIQSDLVHKESNQPLIDKSNLSKGDIISGIQTGKQIGDQGSLFDKGS